MLAIVFNDGVYFLNKWMVMAAFHSNCGERVVLTNNYRTAVRNFSEFNNGIVLSSEPLLDNQLFQVRIEKAINSWSGSIEIGVIACDPDKLELPSSATELRNGSWILSGTSILQNGQNTEEDAYGADLDKLTEGDVVGVMRTDKGELKFFVNGDCHGVAAENVPERVFGVVDLYGRCGQVSIVSPDCDRSEAGDGERTEESQCQISGTTDLLSNLSLSMNLGIQESQSQVVVADRLRFHNRHGTLVKLSCNGRTAERMKPLDEFNNGVVMTHRPLRDDELFEIRIDRLVDKWSGSIEVGVTTHSPNKLEFPATMTNMRSGTTIMSGCGILTNGKGTRREYGEFNLDELREGDRIGMMRKSNGSLHYFINGLDQDAAAEKVPNTVWGVVDLYGMTVKVTIVDRDEREEQNLMTRRNTALRDFQVVLRSNPPTDDGGDRLTFYSNCGTHAAVINSGRTVHRPNAMDDFNNGVALTNRPLKPNELFEIRLDKLVTKWAGSIEIGVTTHYPTQLEYPSTMTNVRSGTWMMTGNGVMHNGSTIVDKYGHNLDRLQVGDRVGAMRKENGALHFYVNGVDQGVASVNVPASVYGVIDLYGQAAQATLMDALDYSPDTDNSSLSNTTLYSDLRFFHVHGRNARVSNNGLTASRPRTLGEFNHAIVITNRPLRECEMFEVKIEQLVDRWSGSIEAGVTAIRPTEFEFPSTMTDMDHDTWILSGSSVMKDGFTVRSGYPCDLDTLPVSTRIGMMRHLDATLHYYINGVDQGSACDNVPPVLYGVIDLYGQCAQVSIVNTTDRVSNPITSDLVTTEPTPHPVSQHLSLLTHRLSICCGKNITLQSANTVALRSSNYAHGLVFSDVPLDNDEYFEVSLMEMCKQWAGGLQLGVTTLPISETFQSANLPPVISALTFDTWYLSGTDVKKNGTTVKAGYCPSMDWLTPGHKVAVHKTSDGVLRFLINGADMGVAAINLPKRVFAVVDVFGAVTKVSVTSVRRHGGCLFSGDSPMASYRSGRLQDSLEIIGEGMSTPTLSRLDYGMDSAIGDLIVPVSADSVQSHSHSNAETVINLQDGCESLLDSELSFSENHGRNIQLSNSMLTARRTCSYNQAVVISSKPLTPGHMFQIRIDKVNPEWVCGLAVGVTSLNPAYIQCPINALCLKEHSWVVSKDCVFKNGRKVKNGYGTNKFTFAAGNTIGVLVDADSQLRVYINGYDLGVAASGVPPGCHAVFDLNGRCEEVTVLCRVSESSTPRPIVTATQRQESQQEKADLEIQEKYPDRQGEPGSEGRSHRRRSSRDLSKIEQKLSSSDSYNSGIQQISCHAASCSFQTDTDNFNTQIQQLTMDLKSDLQRSSLEDDEETEDEAVETSAMTHSDTYNTELQMLSAQTNSINLDELNTQIQQLTTSNSGGEISTNNSTQQHSQSKPNVIDTARSEEKGDDVKEDLTERQTSPAQEECVPEVPVRLSTPVPSVPPPDHADHTDHMEHSDVQTKNAPKNNTRCRRQTTNRQMCQVSNQNLKNSQTFRSHCEYFNACCRFKNMLGLPDGFFVLEPGTCYCYNCYCLEETLKTKGDPPTEYTIPMGWCKFALRKHPAANDKIETWQVAFYGTKPGVIRRILDQGELVTGMERSDVKSKEDDTDSSHIIFSPSIRYAACDYFVSKFEFTDSKWGRRCQATLAFQILVQPGSYKVGPPSHDITKDLDPRFEKDSTEWVTKERGATVLSALLVRVQGTKQ